MRSGPNLRLTWSLALALGGLGLACVPKDEVHAPSLGVGPTKSTLESQTSASEPSVSASEIGSPATAPSSAPVEPPAVAGDEKTFERALLGIAPDPAPPKLTLDQHYLVSNEERLEAFHDVTAGRGGVYVGVGAEQSFLLGGWARAETLFLLDFDDWVVDVNEVHGLVFEHAKTPDEVLDLWSEGRSAEIEKWIDASTSDAAVAAHRKKVYEFGRPQIELRLRWLKAHLTKLSVPFFGNDPAELEHVANLWRNKRVRCVRGDLTAAGTLQALGAIAKKSNKPVRVFYMSNAEEYFDHGTGSFRDNVRALPFDDRSVVLHTASIPHKKDYFYVWQDAGSYVPWMSRAKSFADILREADMPRHASLENGAWRIQPPR